MFDDDNGLLGSRRRRPYFLTDGHAGLARIAPRDQIAYRDVARERDFALKHDDLAASLGVRDPPVLLDLLLTAVHLGAVVPRPLPAEIMQRCEP